MRRFLVNLSRSALLTIIFKISNEFLIRPHLDYGDILSDKSFQKKNKRKKKKQKKKPKTIQSISRNNWHNTIQEKTFMRS